MNQLYPTLSALLVAVRAACPDSLGLTICPCERDAREFEILRDAFIEDAPTQALGDAIRASTPEQHTHLTDTYADGRTAWAGDIIQLSNGFYWAYGA